MQIVAYYIECLLSVTRWRDSHISTNPTPTGICRTSSSSSKVTTPTAQKQASICPAVTPVLFSKFTYIAIQYKTVLTSAHWSFNNNFLQFLRWSISQQENQLGLIAKLISKQFINLVAPLIDGKINVPCIKLNIIVEIIWYIAYQYTTELVTSIFNTSPHPPTHTIGGSNDNRQFYIEWYRYTARTGVCEGGA